MNPNQCYNVDVWEYCSEQAADAYDECLQDYGPNLVPE
jgi:hypothetical protein